MSSGTPSRRGITAENVADIFKHYYSYLVLAILMAFMLWIRIRPLKRFQGEELQHWQAVDPYYHWRSTEWTVRNFPSTMPYEIFTGYPTGNYVGQFGTLFDQFIATIAMLIGLGSPSDSTIALAGLVGVPIIASAVAIPVFYIGRRLGGTVPALLGVAVLAILPGQFLLRSTAGMFQHHAAEVFTMAVAILAMMVALRVAEQEQPVWELVLDRDSAALKRPTLYAVAAGVSIGLYAWVWPPATVLIGIFGVFFIIAIVIEHVRGGSPEPIAFVGFVALVTTMIMSLLLLEQWTLNDTTGMDLLNPIVAMLVAVGSLVLAGLSRFWSSRNFHPLSYPALVGGLGIIGIAVLWLFLPDVYSTVESNVTGRLIPIDPGVGAQTVAEARPPEDIFQFLYDDFGLAFYTMVFGLIALLAQPFYGREYRTEYLLIGLWTLFVISMSITQVRFSYYLALPVATINAYFAAVIFDWVNFPSFDAIKSIKGYQVLAVLLVVLLLFVPLLPPMASASAWQISDDASWPSNDGVTWEETTQFLKGNTPDVGDWGDYENSDELDLWGVYSHPGNGYTYPEGSYGVMTWWDYGHLITTHGERIPHSNPFQQNARSSAYYLLAESEEAANLHLDAIEATGDGVRTNNIDELQAILDEHDKEISNEFRYVIVEDNMLGGKFGAKTDWIGEGIAPYLTQELFTSPNGDEITRTTWNERYYDTIMAQMYHEDGTDLQHYRLVHESADEFSIVGFMAIGGELHQSLRLGSQLGLDFDDYQDYANLDAFLQQAAEENEIVEPFGPGLFAWDATIQPAVKTFERVKGATLTGTAETNSSTVVAEVEIETNANRSFIYRAKTEVDEDGSFELTIPYATDNNLDVDDGYTEPEVQTADSILVSEFTDLDPDDVQQAEELGVMVADVAANLSQQAEVNTTETDIYEGREVPVEFVDPASFEITNAQGPGVVDINETFKIDVEVTNTGDITAEKPIVLSVGEEEIDRDSIMLSPNETANLTFEHKITNESDILLQVTTPDDMVVLIVSATEPDGNETESIVPLTVREMRP